MTVLNNNLLLGADATAATYSIPRSLRFNASDSAYLSRTPASAGNRKTWTWAGWVKRGSLGSRQMIFGNLDSGATLGFDVEFLADNTLDIYDYNVSFVARRTTTQVFRDCSAWYHIVITYDSTNATGVDRLRAYVNGNRVTTFNNSTDPVLNADGQFNTTTATSIGRSGAYSSLYFDGYLADVHFIDGQALDPTSFGQFDTNGVWQPKAYSGTYGTNGFQLKFADNSAATAAALGKDTSGNGNNWTPNNLSVTAGAGNDSLVDSPTNGTASSGGDAGGTVVGNYATLSPITTSSIGLATLANGNLDISKTDTNFTGNVSTIAVTSGKWYWEYTITTLGNRNGPGIIATDSLAAANGAYGFGASSNCWHRATTGGGTGAVLNNSVDVVTGLSGFVVNDVCNVAVDLDAGKLWFGKNGTWDLSGNPSTGTNPTITFTPAGKSYYALAQGYNTWAGTVNFGQRPFAYAAPAGFKSLNTANLPTPTILNGATVFDTKLYTGNGSTQTISGLGFSPDLVWLKRRNLAAWHQLYDQIRGVQKALYSNDTSNELTETTGLTALNSDGFGVGSSLGVNGNSDTYVAWCWDAGTANVTNTQGSITSTVRANPSAGFSIIGWTASGTASTQTVGHGLGVAPQLIITKSRTVAGYNWNVYHSALTPGYNLFLQLTNAQETAPLNGWLGAPTSSVITLTAGSSSNTNVNIGDMIAYCFAPVSGYSSFGSYTGNGSADGPFVYTGFRPRWLLFKNATTGGAAYDWFIADAVRNSYNTIDDLLFPNQSWSENNGSGSYINGIDFLSNGFKIRDASAAWNGSTQTIVYAAFAENPFSIARAR